MSGVEQARQACRDAAANLWQKLNMPGLRWQAELMRDGTGDAGPVVCAFVGLWNKAYAAGRDAERERAAGIAADHVITADDDVQAAYAQCAIDIESEIRIQP